MRDVYTDVFTATDTVLYIIHLFTYSLTYLLIDNDIIAVSVITADGLDRLDHTYTWRFDDAERNVLCVYRDGFHVLRNVSMH